MSPSASRRQRGTTSAPTTALMVSSTAASSASVTPSAPAPPLVTAPTSLPMPPSNQTAATCRGSGQPWDDVLAVGVDDRLLGVVHVVDRELVDAQVTQRLQLGHVRLG